MPATYKTLGQFLAASPANHATLSFRQIELIIKRPLPDSAYHHDAWWDNDPTHAHAKAWLEAGWEVQAVDRERHTVTFHTTTLVL